MQSIKSRLTTRARPWQGQELEGQGLVEYAMLILLVVIACVGAVTGLRTTMQTVFWDVIQNVLIPAMGG